MKNIILNVLLLIGLVLAGSTPWKSDLKFSHKYHIEEAGAECDVCHAAVLTSVSGKDDLLPAMETCYNCHDEKMPCTSCHAKGEEPDLLPRVENYSEKFNHKLHIEKGTSCQVCHTGIESKNEVNEGMHITGMDGCMQCHRTPAETDGCYLCHLENEQLIPVSHTESWSVMHGTASEAGAEKCNLCHQENYCIDCHFGENLDNGSHPAEFLATHAISWQFRENDCSTCHTIDYCIECHTEVNYIIPINHSIEGWNGSLHAREARTDYENCSVCHTDDDMICARCHH